MFIVRPVNWISLFVGFATFSYLMLRLKMFPLALETGVVCGVAVWVVLTLVRRKEQTNLETADTSVVLDECGKHINHINDLIVRLNNTNIRRELGEVSLLLANIFEAIKGDENKHEFALVYLRRYLEPVDNWLTEYDRLTRRSIVHAQRDVQEAEERLPDLRMGLNQFKERIHLPDTTRLALMNEDLQRGLKPPD